MFDNNKKNTSYDPNILVVNEALKLSAGNLHYLIGEHSAKMANEQHQMNFLSELFDETPELKNAA
jgi:hypothetical protein